MGDELVKVVDGRKSFLIMKGERGSRGAPQIAPQKLFYGFTDQIYKAPMYVRASVIMRTQIEVYSKWDRA